MGISLKKRKGYKPMPGYNKSELESKAYLWCIKNNIKISPFAVLKSNPRTWWVDVETNGKVKRSPYKYDENQIWPKIFELYAFYYKKYGLRKTV